MRHLTLLLAIAFAAPAAAGVVSRDLFEPGDGLLTYDDVNQREWLDFSVTEGLSPTELQYQLGETLTLAGFSLATGQDVLSLFESGGSEWEAARIDHDWVSLHGGSRTWHHFGDFQVGSIAELHSTLYALTSQAIDDEGYYAVGFRSIAVSINEQLQPLTYGTFSYPYRCVGQTGSCWVVVGNAGGQEILADIGPPPHLQTYWLYRDAVPTPEPTTAALALAACLGTLRLRGSA